jgi:hypothetical protein
MRVRVMSGQQAAMTALYAAGAIFAGLCALFAFGLVTWTVRKGR